jgi:hypothetical protein
MSTTGNIIAFDQEFGGIIAVINGVRAWGERRSC